MPANLTDMIVKLINFFAEVLIALGMEDMAAKLKDYAVIPEDDMAL